MPHENDQYGSQGGQGGQGGRRRREEGDFGVGSQGYTQTGQRQAAGDAGYGSSMTQGDRGSQFSDQSQGGTQAAQEKAQEMSRKARERADEGLDKAAGGMEQAASNLRERASQQEGMTAEVGTKVADTLDKTSGYLKEHDTSEIVDDIEKYVREHPMQAVAGAVIGGFVLARLFR